MLVPIMCELTGNTCKQTKVFGLSTINNIRTRAILARHFMLDVGQLNESRIPIYGGHCDGTIMPFLSQASSMVQITEVSLQE